MSELGRDPIELLTNKHLIKPHWLTDKALPLLCGGSGLIISCYQNYVLRKPALSGLQRHLAWTIGGVVAGVFIEKYRSEYYAEKDAVLRHYIELHPDDFPRAVRKKYKDVFEEWIPIR